MKYITANIRAVKVYHGYTEDRKIIVDQLPPEDYVEKVIKIDRILSITAKYIFIETPHNTVQSWEYNDGFENLKERLASAGMLID